MTDAPEYPETEESLFNQILEDEREEFAAAGM